MTNSACFIGHRSINDTPELRAALTNTVIKLIESGTVNFIFGDNSDFDKLCLKVVTELKQKYPGIHRIHFRRNYPELNDYNIQFFLNGYDESIFPAGVFPGKGSYIQRNRAMINESYICVFYYSTDNCSGSNGTKSAYDYAVKHNKIIINLFPKNLDVAFRLI